VLSAAGDEVDKVLLLEIGADDTSSSRSAAASWWRGFGGVARASPEAHQILRFGETEVDPDAAASCAAGRKEVKLTPAEYNLLTISSESRPGAHARHDSEFGLGYESFPNTRDRDAHVVKLGRSSSRTRHSPAFHHRARGGLPVPALRAVIFTESLQVCRRARAWRFRQWDVRLESPGMARIVLIVDDLEPCAGIRKSALSGTTRTSKSLCATAPAARSSSSTARTAPRWRC